MLIPTQWVVVLLTILYVSGWDKVLQCNLQVQVPAPVRVDAVAEFWFKLGTSGLSNNEIIGIVLSDDCKSSGSSLKTSSTEKRASGWNEKSPSEDRFSSPAFQGGQIPFTSLFIIQILFISFLWGAYFSLLTSFSPSYIWFVFLRTMVGCGVSGHAQG